VTVATPTEDRLLDHDYDGIREYDNPLPRWWLWIFYATILFVPVYYLAPGDIGAGPGMVAAYEADMARHRASQPAPAAPVSDEAIVALVGNPEVVAEGKAVFAQNCVACHRADGGGLIGPNLTDEAWIHGGTPSAIHKTITDGVLAKGMPPWGRLLQPAQVDEVTAYVLSIRGTNPPAPKAPEGAAAAPAPPAPPTGN